MCRPACWAPGTSWFRHRRRLRGRSPDFSPTRPDSRAGGGGVPGGGPESAGLEVVLAVAAVRGAGRGCSSFVFAVRAGNMDSLITLHGEQEGLATTIPIRRPASGSGCDRTAPQLVYCQRAREPFPGVPVIAGGVEASLRSAGHYDYWSDTVKRSSCSTRRADVGSILRMASRTSVTIAAQRLAAARRCATWGDLRGCDLRAGGEE